MKVDVIHVAINIALDPVQVILYDTRVLFLGIKIVWCVYSQFLRIGDGRREKYVPLYA